MIRVFIDASTFGILSIQHDENPYVDIHSRHSKHKSMKQHSNLVRACTASPSVVCKLPRPLHPLTDIVFCADAGLSLPRLGRPLLLLPHMKYKHRQDELPYLKQCFKSIQLETMEYPGKEPFEGQAELKWFHGGRKAVCGYGFRSTKKTFTELDQLFQKLYGDEKPELLVIRLISQRYYHLDIAMLEFNDNRCIVHRRAISTASLRKLEQFLGKDHVDVIDTPDSFCLNAVVDGAHLITHKLTDPYLSSKLESITGLVVKQVDVSEFEKSGGAVRCMTLDIHSGV